MILLRYVIKRLAYAVLTLFVLIALTFFMMRMLPGDPFIGDKAISETAMANMNAKYGLDKPVIAQFLMYVGNCLKGDLGISITYNRPVMGIITDAFAVSVDLGVRALIFAVIAGVLLGAVAAIRRGSILDSFSMLISLIGVSVPSFIMGAMFQYFLALQLRKWLGITIFPIQGWGSFQQTLLPAFALGLGSLATVSRLMRTSMLDVLGQDYIKTAKAKGLSERKILWKHAMRNAIMPVVTVMGPTVAAVLTGTFVIESIFNIPGLGKYFVISVKDLDYTMISGTVIFYGGLLILCTLVVDLLYGLIDPRVKLEG
ncbi:MAG: ABC transporter permease [Oscillospiraceae bacterium]|jgi:oligopeptide transport system permease protein|nr:ABC transporter permease [Oscillospiraceae bacterium]